MSDIGNEAGPQKDTLAEDIFRAAQTSIFSYDLDVQPPSYPFDIGFQDELMLTLVNGEITSPITETESDRDARHKAAAVVAADMARTVIARTPKAWKVIGGVTYYSEEVVGLAALAGAAKANRHSADVLAKWKDALTKDPLDRIKAVIQALGAHMCIEDPIGKLTEVKVKAKS